MSFGSVLRNLLEENNLRQRQLADDLHLSPSAVGKYISDIREPNLATIKAIADYFSVSTDFLLEHSSPSAVPFDESQRQLLQIFTQLSPADQQLWLEQGKLLTRFQHPAAPPEF